MKLAFYYHVTICNDNNNLKTVGLFGVFLEALAKEVDELVLIMHQANPTEESSCDHTIRASNITWINIGLKTAAWHRELFHRSILKQALQKIQDCDALIVRSPTPLAAYFHKYLDGPKLWFMIVGDYLGAIEHYKKSTLRDLLIYYYLFVNDYFFQKRIKKTDILVNSPALYKKYADKSKSIHLIRTTTLSESDFFERSDTCHHSSINLIYTGIFSPAKGLIELVDAIIYLTRENIPIVMHFVGWEDAPDKPVETKLLEQAKKGGAHDKIIFHGKKKVGPELNSMYQMADIFIMPSYHEGFPRTIWEAMANSLPVIATRVGGIPEFLTHNENAYLIAPKSSIAIVDAVKTLLSNTSLRRRLISSGHTLAKENTLAIQTKKLVEILKNNQL